MWQNKIKIIIIDRAPWLGGIITCVGMDTLGWYRQDEGVVESKNSMNRQLERIAKQLGSTTKFPYNDSECLQTEKNLLYLF